MLYSNVKIDYNTVNMAHPSDKKKEKIRTESEDSKE